MAKGLCITGCGRCINAGEFLHYIVMTHPVTPRFTLGLSFNNYPSEIERSCWFLPDSSKWNHHKITNEKWECLQLADSCTKPLHRIHTQDHLDLKLLKIQLSANSTLWSTSFLPLWWLWSLFIIYVRWGWVNFSQNWKSYLTPSSFCPLLFHAHLYFFFFLSVH